MRVVRFFHIRLPNTIKGGATVRVTGEVGGECVTVQVTYCSQKTGFCRREGRQYAGLKKEETILLNALPKKLMRVAHNVVKLNKRITPRNRGLHDLWNTIPEDFEFSMRYFKQREPKIVMPDTSLAEQAAILEAEDSALYLPAHQG